MPIDASNSLTFSIQNFPILCFNLKRMKMKISMAMLTIYLSLMVPPGFLEETRIDTFTYLSHSYLAHSYPKKLSSFPLPPSPPVPSPPTHSFRFFQTFIIAQYLNLFTIPLCNGCFYFFLNCVTTPCFNSQLTANLT